jgi:hypothetical protein
VRHTESISTTTFGLRRTPGFTREATSNSSVNTPESVRVARPPDHVYGSRTTWETISLRRIFRHRRDADHARNLVTAPAESLFSLGRHLSTWPRGPVFRLQETRTSVAGRSSMYALPGGPA